MYQITLSKDEATLLIAMVSAAVGLVSNDVALRTTGVLGVVLAPRNVHEGLSSSVKTLMESVH